VTSGLGQKSPEGSVGDASEAAKDGNAGAEHQERPSVLPCGQGPLATFLLIINLIELIFHAPKTGRSLLVHGNPLESATGSRGKKYEK
jgi:hypothetical protein